MNRSLFTLIATRYSLTAIRCILLTASIGILSGCSIDPRYAAEKSFWQAHQTIAKMAEKTGGQIRSEDLPKVIEIHKRAINAYPLDPITARAQFAITNMYMSIGKREEARKELKKIINNFSRNAQIATQAYFAIGKIYELEENYKAALEEYDKITDLYPLSPLGSETPLYKIRLQKKIDEGSGQEQAYKDAVRHYKDLINKYADTNIAIGLRDYLARAHVEGEKWDSAIKAWDEILDKDIKGPLAAKALLARASIYATKMNDPSQAAEIYKDFLKKYPENEQLGIRARLALAECLQKEGAQKEVVEGYEEIQRLYPDNPMAWGIPYLLYRHYSHIQDASKSQEALQTAIAEYEKEFESSSSDDKRISIAQLLMLCYNETKD